MASETGGLLASVGLSSGAGLDFTPHTQTDLDVMLERIGVSSVEDLFALVPEAIRFRRPLDVPGPYSEPELLDHMGALGSRNRPTGAELVCFAGAGAYDHHVPPVVTHLATRPEFATAYTSYQPEVSQGVLQSLFEFQTMLCLLAGTEVANASLYDGATACVEALNLARARTKRDRVLVSRGVNPLWREVVATFAHGSGVEVVEVDLVDGRVDPAGLSLDDAAAVLVAQPNYLGILEDVPRVAAAAQGAGALCLVAYDHVASGWLRPPGELGADVVVGEGQAFGTPLNFGGPYLGLFSTKREYVRLVPGRIVGETADAAGRPGYVLTLQAREQHIRREKASSNVCTNQTLMAVTAAVHLAWLGPQGLRRVAGLSRAKTAYLRERVAAIPGVEIVPGPVFREFAVRLPVPAAEVLDAMSAAGFLAGVSLDADYPELGPAMLVAVTERRSRGELDTYIQALTKAVA